MIVCRRELGRGAHEGGRAVWRHFQGSAQRTPCSFRCRGMPLPCHPAPCLRLLLLSLAGCLPSPAAASSAASRRAGDGAAGMSVIYDRAGVHPQCSQGPKAYMADCVLPSDYFSYILSADPYARPPPPLPPLPAVSPGSDAVAPQGAGRERAELLRAGLHAHPDRPDLPRLRALLEGRTRRLRRLGRGLRCASPSTIAALRRVAAWSHGRGVCGWAGPGHPDNQKFLNASRDSRPACKLPATPTPPTARAGATAPAAAAVAAGAVVTSYDKSGSLPQCAEGPAAYMTDCVHPCDFVAYFKSERPTLLEGSHCAAMGYVRTARLSQPGPNHNRDRPSSFVLSVRG